METVAESKPCILEYLPPTPKWALPIVKQEAKVIMNLNMSKSYELGRGGGRGRVFFLYLVLQSVRDLMLI